MRIKLLYLLNIILTFVLITSLLANITVNRSRTAATKEYDPWKDMNLDGKINILDLVILAGYFGTSGTAINTTALLLELQAKIESLNSSLVEFQSRVEALEIRIPKIGYLTLPPQAFTPFSNIQCYERWMFFLKGNGSFYSPVQLPNGAIVKNITAQLEDGRTDGSVTVGLVRENLSRTEFAGLGSVGTTYSEHPGSILLHDDTIEYAQIDNQNYMYTVEVTITYQDWNLGLYWVQIEYEYQA